MIYLASQSPRRSELLNQIGVVFKIVNIKIDETPFSGELPSDYVLRMAQEKAQAGWHKILSFPKAPILAADTAVVCDNQIFGKPKHVDDARRMLETLSESKHQVMTAVAIKDGDRICTEVSVTDVVFNKLFDQLISDYIKTGEPKDKAGAYAIQGLGAVFIASISGSYSGVVGLPLTETTHLLKQFNVPIWETC